MSKVNVLLVGGYDPTGGAGIVADVKTVEVVGCNPLTVITSLIPQNNKRVYSKMDLPRDVIEDQLQAIFEDFQVPIVKTGVLTEDAIDVLLKYHKEYNFKIVCDPVLRSTTGYNFIDEKTLEKYFKLFKRSLLILPNSQEYNIIRQSKYFKDLEKGNNYILITGIEDKLLYKGKIIRRFRGRKIDREVHGTGCVFASAVASFIAKGYNIVDAIEEGKRVVLASVIYATKTKYGYNSNPIYINRERILKSLYYALHLLREMDLQSLIPEGDSYIGECLILPRDIEDIASLRITGKGAVEYVKFGVSNIVSKAIITANYYDPKVRGAITIKCSSDILETLRKCGFSLFPLPDGMEIRGIEEGIKVVYEKFEGVPDAIYFKDKVIIFGEDGVDVVKKVKRACEVLR
ncbi:phosphomethylpyrimidine kinase [Methanofervidicoccus sp. A16]|uniref:bifunctional hydroxymethylpyrimidine kinase/phosphomethylpyrimidine kinase n=1 Tax=Methanofervidicoccus sp. A16 TaxID=2607662 RepID=UPI00118C2925|nr:bifunctional hydroxymethylpyrimidine kinase/phosphomethylpyrimidine kinase [Methanofervidicoccus sp. A16]AXI25880.1 phosphomethylpyrimidine kinase [Methanofervidicoccus sp. A16]